PLFRSPGLAGVGHLAEAAWGSQRCRPEEPGPSAVGYGRPGHPYPRILMAAPPRVNPALRAERVIPKGELPSPLNPPPGCPFHKRCPHATERCATEVPALRPVDERLVACHFAEEMA
ncbi:dipeptide ABC transporter ATP-binding protein, partial [Azospirillum brasilense]|nr:dipeptide ABC transporter ATP-binding protein [Azospirillum brasilense]